MHLLYLDESGDPGFRGTRHYVLLGLAIADREVKAASAEVDKLVLRRLGPRAEGGELHYRSLLRGKGLFRGMSDAARRRVADDVFRLLRRLPVTLFAAVVDTRKHQQQSLFPQRPDLWALALIVERFDAFLRRGRRSGCVVYDSRNRPQDSELRAFFDVLSRQGPRHLRPRRIVETVFFTPSHSTRLLQLADFCAYAVFSRYERPGKARRFAQIESQFYVDRRGQRAGLVEWPR